MFEYDDCVATHYWGMKLNCQVTACIAVGPIEDMLEDLDDDDEEVLEYDQNVVKLVAACCNVGFLYLSMSSVIVSFLSLLC